MRRAVVTGIGVVAPSGLGAEQHWGSTLRGELRVGPIQRFDASPYGTTLAGQVTGFQPERFVDNRLQVQTDRWTWLAFAQAQLALDDAGYDPRAVDPYRTSVILASASGGNEFGQREIAALWSRGPRSVTAYQSIAWFYAASTGQISIRHRTKGAAGVIVSDAAGGLDSLGHARRVIRRGTPTVLAGGTEAPLSPYALACQAMTSRMTVAREPTDGYKPFDIRANGYAPGEGGAILVLEDAGSAAVRGSRGYGEVAGYAATHDAHHHERPAPDARQYGRAMQLAIRDAGLAPEDVDLVIADGAGSVDLD